MSCNVWADHTDCISIDRDDPNRTASAQFRWNPVIVVIAAGLRICFTIFEWITASF